MSQVLIFVCFAVQTNTYYMSSTEIREVSQEYLLITDIKYLPVMNHVIL